MKFNIIPYKQSCFADGVRALLLPAFTAFVFTSCNKLLDKQPITQTIAADSTISISAKEAEDQAAGSYITYKGYDYGLEFNVFDRLVNTEVVSDNAYAGGDNTANINLDLFTTNSLNSNLARDWKDAYSIIGRFNITIDEVQRCTDAALSATRKNQILGEVKFMRAFLYFDLVRLFGQVPLYLKPANTSSAQALLNSTLLPQSSTDSVYQTILNDLWFAKGAVRDVGASPFKQIISKGAVYATLAKVYASMPTPNWDSVLYYCNLTIPNYALVSNYTYLWDNAHKNSSEAIWELNYDGYSAGDQIGNWVPSIFIGGGWKKFNTPTNDLVNAFLAEGDNVRLNASITFEDVSGQWADKYWQLNHYPFLTKYNDPLHGVNDFYMIRLADILLLKAEALVQKSDIAGAMVLVNQVRARVGLAAKTASSADAANTIIANERRLELAFEGHRWYDLLRTGKALSVMNAQKDGSGNNLNYNVPSYRLVMPIPQTQIDLNPLLTQNPQY